MEMNKERALKTGENKRMNHAGKRVFLDVVGCPENRYDVGQLQAYIEQTGGMVTTSPEDADVIVINTCGLTGMNEDISREMIERARKRNPHCRIIASGCLPIINKEALEKCGDIEIVPGAHVEEVLWKDEQRTATGEFHNPWIYPHRLLFGQENIIRPSQGLLWMLDKILYRWTSICPPLRPRYYVKIATGCNRPCSYCAVKISRGNLKSKPMEWVVERVREGVNKGYRDISLIGTNVSGYGQDIGADLPALLKQLLSIDPNVRFELRNAEPEEVSRFLPEFTEVLKSGRITYLEFPLQSGSNRILKLMKRGYTVEDFTHSFEEMKKAAPRLFIRSQIMVGFPTETEEDFQQSLEMVDNTPFDYVESFCFSARPGTRAAEMDGQISRKAARARYKTLKKKIMRSRVNHKIGIFTRFVLETLAHPGYFFIRNNKYK